MSEHFTGIDWLVIAVYFAASLAIGFAVYRRTRNPEAFTAAKRSLPGWACGLSIFATYVSSISFLALPGKAFASNWNPFVFSLSLPLTTWIAVRYFLPWYRNSGDVSAYAHLEHRFGPWARAYAGFFYLLTQLARMGTVMYLMALPMSVLMGWDLATIIIVTGVSVTLYSLLGGLVAVIWADSLQAVVLIVGALACTGFIFFNMPEGPGQVLAIAAEHHKFNLGSFGSSLTEQTFWVMLAYGVIHQPAELRHRPELYSTLHRFALGRPGPTKRLARRLAVSARLGGVLPDRHGLVRVLPDASGRYGQAP